MNNNNFEYILGGSHFTKKIFRNLFNLYLENYICKHSRTPPAHLHLGHQLPSNRSSNHQHKRRPMLSKLRPQKYFHRYSPKHDPVTKIELIRLNALIRLQINLYKQQQWINTTSNTDYRDGSKFWNKFKFIIGQKSKTPTKKLTLKYTLPLTRKP